MKRGFYTIMSAQFFSSLADQALFVAAVELLRSAGAAEWQRAALVPIFAVFYVALAPVVGAFADALPKGRVVMLKLSLPVEPDLYKPIVDHPQVVRVVALSGGFARPEACVELAKNSGVIASFSRALLEDLRSQMSDEEFDKALGAAIDEIYEASVA